MNGEMTTVEMMDAMVRAMGTVVPDKLSLKGACYVSMPITGGKRALDYHRKNTDRGLKFNIEVITPNVEAGRNVVASARGIFHTVINPGAIYIPSWGQPEYLSFWNMVLRKYVHTVMFVDGWQYSPGCVFEFGVAIENGLQLRDENDNLITVAEGVTLIEKAIAEYPEAEMLKQRLEQLKGRVST